MKATFDYIVSEANSSEGLNIKQTAQFHYFNKNGAYAAKKESDERISKAVSDKILKSGCIIAYGSMNDYWSEQLRAVVGGKRVKRSLLNMIIEHIYKDVQKANEVLATKGDLHE